MGDNSSTSFPFSSPVYEDDFEQSININSSTSLPLSSPAYDVYEDDFDQSIEDTIQKYEAISSGIVIYGYPFVMFPGVVGNVLCIITLRTKQFAENNTALLLTLLAVVDITALFVQGLNSWLSYMDIVDITASTTGLCKMWTYVYYLFIHLSAWLLVLITAERLVIVQWPHNHKNVCSRKVVICSAVVVVLVLMALNLYLPITSVAVTYGTNTTSWRECDIRVPLDKVWLYDFRTWSDMVLSCLLPFFLILVGNILLIIKLTLKNKQKNTLLPTKSKAAKSVTIMLMLASFTFLFTSLPINIILLTIDHLFPDWQTDDLMYAWSDIFFWAASILTFSNHAINFVLYFISGPTFRHAFYNVFCAPKIADISQTSGKKKKRTNRPCTLESIDENASQSSNRKSRKTNISPMLESEDERVFRSGNQKPRRTNKSPTLKSVDENTSQSGSQKQTTVNLSLSLESNNENESEF